MADEKKAPEGRRESIISVTARGEGLDAVNTLLASGWMLISVEPMTDGSGRIIFGLQDMRKSRDTECKATVKWEAPECRHEQPIKQEGLDIDEVAGMIHSTISNVFERME